MSTTTFDSGDILLVRVPYTDLSGFKQRPALVLSPKAYSQRGGDLLVMALTSVPQADARLALKDWRKAGLLKLSWLKPGIATVSDSLVVHRLGSVLGGDVAAVKHAIRQCIDSHWL